MITVQAALSLANTILRDAKIETAPRDARRIMAATLGVGADRITLHMQDKLGVAEEAAFFASIQLRMDGQPVSHLVGGRDFFDRWFIVNADVLDPRPETEILIQTALEVPFSEVLDLGTGSGAIAVTLLAERPDATGTATDISTAALEMAERNATSHSVADRLHFEVSDWYAAVGGQFDLIVSNPPYIAADEMDGLQPEVRLHEPRFALTDEADGLTAYRKITAGAPDHLTPGGRLIVEIGPTQAKAVAEMMREAGLQQIRIIQDLDGRDRVVSGVNA